MCERARKTGGFSQIRSYFLKLSLFRRKKISACSVSKRKRNTEHRECNCNGRIAILLTETVGVKTHGAE